MDEIPTSIVKVTSENILYLSTHIFYLFLVQGKFIDAFNKVKVIPVHRKGLKIYANNYSLLPVISKILEKILYERLFSFSNGASFFYQHQFGSRKNHFTNNALSIIIEYIARAFEDKKYAMGVFLDLSKAFYTFDHSILLFKLHHHEIRRLP